jgi:hypothetical protein
MIRLKEKKANIFRPEKKLKFFGFSLALALVAFFALAVSPALAIDGLMNGKTITGETDNYLFSLQTYDPVSAPYFFDRVFVNKEGQLSIGNATPAYKLDVSGTGRFTQPVIVGTPTATDHAATKSYVDSTIGGGSGSTVGYWTMNGTNISNSNTGNVGIGTTAPVAKLDVNGVIKGTILASANIWSDTSMGSFGGYNSMTFSSDSWPVGSKAFSFLTYPNSGSGVTNEKIAIYNGDSGNIILNPIGGSVGIGITAPAYKLDVSGTGRFTQPVIVGTPTDTNHAATKSYVDSTAGGGVGAGTSGQTLRHNGTSWVANSVLYNNGTNVGIGTVSPGNKLTIVSGSLTSIPVLGVNGGGFGVLGNSGLYGLISGILGSGNAYVQAQRVDGTATAYNLLLQPNGGSVGIGTTAPTYKLDVSGTGRFTQPVIVGTPTLAGHATTKSYVDSAAGGGVGAGTSGQTLRHNGTSWVANSNIYNNGTNVGIGTTAPGMKLDVSGAIRTNNQLISTVATGTAPIAVNSNTLVTNLNADFWDGYSWEDLQIGARNYYTKTKKPLVVVGTGNSNQIVYGDYPVANGNLQNNGLNVGDRVVLSYKWKAINTGDDWGSGSFYMRFYNGVNWYTIHSNIPVNAANNEGFVETVLTLNSDSVLTQNFYPRLVSIPTNVTLSFSEVKIEKGNKATSWLPATEDMVLYDANGNVGIGTTAPAYKLDVSGTGRFTQPVIVGTPTATDHAATKNYVDSIAVAAAGGGVGAGTSGQTLRHNGTSWVANSNLYNNGTNVGIGTTNPTSKIHVEGIGANIRIQNSGFNTGQSSITFGHGGASYEKTGIVALATGSWGKSDFYLVLDSESDSGPFNLASDTKMIIKNSGSVGIGTTAPTYKLDVAGTGHFTQPVIVGAPTATEHATTKSYVDSAVASGVTGGISGTINYISKFTGANTIGNSQIFDNGANVGIGTNAPGAKMEIMQNMSDYNNSFASSHLNLGTSNTVDSTGFVGITFDSSTTANYGWAVGALRSTNGSSDFVWKNHLNSVSGTEMMRILSNGSVGINTTVPAYKLDVSGTGRFTQPVIVGTPTATNHAATKSYVDSTAGGGVGAGTSGQTLRHNGTSWVANSVLYNNGTNVGIGTTNPLVKLQVGTDNTGESVTLGSLTPQMIVMGPQNNISDASLLRLVRPTYSGNLYPASVDFKVKSFGTLGSPYLPKTQLTIGLKDGSGYDTGSVVDVMTLRSDGSVGIGTTAPDKKLTVKQSNDTDGIRVYGSTVPTSYFDLFINNAGNPRFATNNQMVFEALGGLYFRSGSTGTFFNDGSARNTSFNNGQLYLASNGNLGIGTTTPAYKLDVSGTGRFTQPVIVGTPTANNHAATKSYVDSTAGGGVGAGTSGQTLRHNGTSWVANSVLYNNGTNVGIGTTAPAGKLHVNNTSAFDVTETPVGQDSLLLYGGANTLGYYGGISWLGGSRRRAGISSVVENVDSDYLGLAFFTQGTDGSGPMAESLRISHSGNVGIATTTPAYKLDVAGTGRFTQPVLVGTPTATDHAATKSYVDSTAVAAAGGGIPVAANGYTLRASGTSWVANSVLYNNGTNVGIGTVSPGPSKLNVSGIANGTDSLVTINNNSGTGRGLFINSNGTTNVGFVVQTPLSTSLATGRVFSGMVQGEPWARFMFYSDGKYGIGSGNSDRDIFLNRSSANTFKISSDGNNGIGNLVVTGSVGIGNTAPAYKLDVTGTGRFTQPVIVGTPTATNHATTKSYVDSSINFRPVHSGSDFANGTLVSTDIPATATNGSSFVIEISGKSYSTSNAPFKVIAQGYLYNNTIVSYSGISYGGNFAPYIKMFEDGGYLKFWWPRISYWNSFNVSVREAGGSPTNRVTSITDSTEPVGTKKVQVDLQNTWNSANSNRSTVDWNARNLYVNGSVGIGTTAPAYKLDVSGTGRFTQPVIVGTPTATNHAVTKSYVDSTAGGGVGAGTSGQTLRHNGTSWVANSVLYNNGTNVGIGTTAPGADLHIGSGELGYVDRTRLIIQPPQHTGGPWKINARDDSTYAYLDFSYGANKRVTLNSSGSVGIGTTAPGAYKLNVAGSAYIGGALELSAGSNLVTSGTISANKINVGTIDPLYNLKGTNYASFAASVVGGVKEETTGKLLIDQAVAGEYQKTIDFKRQTVGSDLWVWYNVIDFSKDNVEVLLTPYGKPANVYYSISEEKLTFHSDVPVEVSYRLIAKRFDWKDWPTKAKDQTEKPNFILK